MNLKNFLKPQHILLATGLLIMFSCAFLALFTTCRLVNGPEEAIGIDIPGAASFTYYLGWIFSCFIIMCGFTGEGSLIGVILITLVGGAIVLFFNALGQAGWGKPCGRHPTSLIYLLYTGNLLVVIASILNIVLKRKERIDEDLLGN